MQLRLSFFLALICAVNLSAQVTFADRIIVDESLSADGAWGVFLADLDGDGDEDLLSASNNDNKIAWYENVGGQGIFDTQNVLSEDAEGTRAVYAADLDGDGDLDVVSSSFDDSKIAWYENLNGNGDFGNEQIIVENTNQIFGPNTIYAVDIDGDEDLDILTSSFFDNKISWIENLNGQGNFGTPQAISTNLTFAGFTYPADLDGDGDLDVLGVSSSDSKLVWHENLNGQGSFSTGITIANNASQPQETYAADLDGDGDLDVLLTSTGDDRVVWYENTDGAGDFGPRQTITSSLNGALSVLAGDFDNDGDQDVVATSQFDNEIVWFENTNGQGDFGSEQLIPTDLADPRSLAISDVDNDGDLDIFSASSADDNISWYKNTNSLGAFSPPNKVTKSVQSPRSVTTADLNSDGNLDVLSASFGDDRIAWHENISGSGVVGWAQKDISRQAFDARYVDHADVDNDGDQDVLAAYNDQIVWYENLGVDLNFGVPQIISDEVGSARVIQTADFDGDGDQDVVSLSTTDSKVAWYENTNGLGNFGPQQILSTNFNFSESLITADLDGDNDIDIIYTARDEDKVVWHQNTDGQGTFGPEFVVSTTVDGVDAVFAADMDGDGDQDLVVSATNENKVAWFDNLDGMGNFSGENIISNTINAPTAILVLDLDGDGDADVVTSNIVDDELVYFENIDGAGLFGSQQLISTNIDGSVALTAGDIDSDGDLDIISSATLLNQITWHENLSPTANEIFGRIKFDLDNNGCDESDADIVNLMVSTDNGTDQLATFTNINGVYQLFPSTGSFTTAPVLENFSFSPTAYTSDFFTLGNTDNGDFCIQASQSIVDLSVSLYPLTEARPGFDVAYQLVYQNRGTASQSDVITLEFDDTKLDFLNANAPIATETANTLAFDFTDLHPFETRTIDLNFNVLAPPVVEIDDILNFTATIAPVAGDDTEEDNVFNFDQIVIGSFDPNDISVIEGATILIDEVDNYLHYIIRFQNTGTASAINVRVENILDGQLDATTLSLESSSHTNRVEIKGGNNVVFLFDNINLPDSTTNEPLSNGFITYKIKPRADLNIGNVILNDAEIYFDFNLPIETNTVSTEIVEPVAITEINRSLGFQVSPNPTGRYLNISAQTEIARVEIYNSQGQLIITKLNGSKIDLDGLNSGIYFCKVINTQGNSGVRAIIKE